VSTSEWQIPCRGMQAVRVAQARRVALAPTAN